MSDQTQPQDSEAVLRNVAREVSNALTAQITALHLATEKSLKAATEAAAATAKMEAERQQWEAERERVERAFAARQALLEAQAEDVIARAQLAEKRKRLARELDDEETRLEDYHGMVMERAQRELDQYLPELRATIEGQGQDTDPEPETEGQGNE